MAGDAPKSFRGRSFGFCGDIGFSRIPGFYHARLDRYLPEKGRIEVLSHFSAAPLFKDIDCFATFGADETTHVFDHAEDR